VLSGGQERNFSEKKNLPHRIEIFLSFDIIEEGCMGSENFGPYIPGSTVALFGRQ
jgi:hypothetical protein